MDKIKMSEVFKDRQASYSVSMSDKQCLAAQHAIDSYDANQERITELDELRKGSMSCIKRQREEIAELKAMVNKLNDAAQKLNSCAAKNMYGETVVNTKHFIELITLSNKLKEQK